MRRLLVLILVCALAACGGESSSGRYSTTGKDYRTSIAGRGMEKTHPDSVSERRISLLQPESGERVDVVYYHDGQYDPAAMQRIDYLFRDRHAGVTADIDPELIDYLVDIRKRFGLPPSVTIEILNGYRTPETNIMMSHQNKNVAIESLHTRGWAVDFRIPSVNGQAIAEIAKTMQRGGVAYYPKSNHIHIDLGAIRTWQER